MQKYYNVDDLSYVDPVNVAAYEAYKDIWLQQHPVCSIADMGLTCKVGILRCALKCPKGDDAYLSLVESDLFPDSKTRGYLDSSYNHHEIESLLNACMASDREDVFSRILSSIRLPWWKRMRVALRRRRHLDDSWVRVRSPSQYVSTAVLLGAERCFDYLMSVCEPDCFCSSSALYPITCPTVFPSIPSHFTVTSNTLTMLKRLHVRYVQTVRRPSKGLCILSLLLSTCIHTLLQDRTGSMQDQTDLWVELIKLYDAVLDDIKEGIVSKHPRHTMEFTTDLMSQFDINHRPFSGLLASSQLSICRLQLNMIANSSRWMGMWKLLRGRTQLLEESYTLQGLVDALESMVRRCKDLPLVYSSHMTETHMPLPLFDSGFLATFKTWNEQSEYWLSSTIKNRLLLLDDDFILFYLEYFRQNVGQ